MAHQSWNASQYIDHAAFVAELGVPLVALLNPSRGEKILDLGCGDGALTMKIAQTGASVHGVDASESMIAAAVLRGLSAEVCSGESLNFNNQFDAVFSNAALHWMTDYQAVIGGVHRALKPNGRFVGELGGLGNIAALIDAMERVFAQHDDFGQFKNPWFFPSAEVYQAALEQGGFRVSHIETIERPTPLKTGVREWLKLFANSVTQALSQDQKACFHEETEALLKPVLYSEQEGWIADYVRLRFAAFKV